MILDRKLRPNGFPQNKKKQCYQVRFQSHLSDTERKQKNVDIVVLPSLTDLVPFNKSSKSSISRR